MMGKLIVFEGIEGCGKTTQMGYLYAWLEQSPLSQALLRAGCLSSIVCTREPGGTALGQRLRQLLLQGQEAETPLERAELLLYAADRAQHVAEFIQPHLPQGALVLCDRYVDSTVAYQGYGRGLDLELIEQLNGIATSGLGSDLTLWLQVDVSVGLARSQQRGRLDRMEQADFAFHQRVQRGFEILAQQQCDRIRPIDGERPVAEVAQDIQALVEQQLRQWYPSFSIP